MPEKMPAPRTNKRKYLRSDITVKGRVQVVGFRDTIKDTAIRNNVHGETRNLSNYDVSIVCEGTKNNIINFEQELDNLKESTQNKKREISQLNRRLKKVQEKIKKYRKNRSMLLELKKAELLLKKEMRLREIPEPEITTIKTRHTTIPRTSFSGFRVIRDIDEQGERLDFGAQQLVRLQKETIDNINFNLMDINFDRMDFKYGAISKSMTKLIETQDEFIKSMREDRKEMKTLVDNINSLVDLALKTSPR